MVVVFFSKSQFSLQSFLVSEINLHTVQSLRKIPSPCFVDLFNIIFLRSAFVFSNPLQRIQLFPLSQTPFSLGERCEKKRNSRSRRLETPSPEREMNNFQVETSNTGNETSTNSNSDVQQGLGDGISENHLTEPSLISNEIQTWTQMFEERDNDRIAKIREKKTIN